MKESYEALSMEVIAFETEDLTGFDIINASGGSEGDVDSAIGGSYWFRG